MTRLMLNNLDQYGIKIKLGWLLAIITHMTALMSNLMHNMQFQPPKPYFESTDIQGRSKNLRHFYPSMELKLGIFGFSPVIIITMVHQLHRSSVSTVVWAWRQACVKRRTALKDHGRICFAFIFAFAVGKNLKTPNLSSMGAITRGGIREGWNLCCISVFESEIATDWTTSRVCSHNLKLGCFESQFKIYQSLFFFFFNVCILKQIVQELKNDNWDSSRPSGF